MTPGERVKELRLKLGLSQAAFGKRLGVMNAAIAKIENLENNVTEQMMKLICYEFNINDIWLRTGEGDMLIQNTQKNISKDEEEILKIYRGISFESRIKFLNFIVSLKDDIS